MKIKKPRIGWMPFVIKKLERKDLENKENIKFIKKLKKTSQRYINFILSIVDAEAMLSYDQKKKLQDENYNVVLDDFIDTFNFGYERGAIENAIKISAWHKEKVRKCMQNKQIKTKNMTKK